MKIPAPHGIGFIAAAAVMTTVDGVLLTLPSFTNSENTYLRLPGEFSVDFAVYRGYNHHQVFEHGNRSRSK